MQVSIIMTRKRVNWDRILERIVGETSLVGGVSFVEEEESADASQMQRVFSTRVNMAKQRMVVLEDLNILLFTMGKDD